MQDPRRAALSAREPGSAFTHWFPVDPTVVKFLFESSRSQPVNPPLPDHDLVRRVIAREPIACEAFVERMRCVTRIVDAMNRASGRPLDSDESQDLAQQAITEILVHLPQFPPGGVLDRWVFCFCRNVFLNRVRKHWRRAASPLDAVTEPAQDDPTRDDLLDIAVFHEAFACLSPDDRALIEARHLDELTFDEIARRWNIPASTLKTRHGAAMHRLRRRLAPKFGYHPDDGANDRTGRAGEGST